MSCSVGSHARILFESKQSNMASVAVFRKMITRTILSQNPRHSIAWIAAWRIGFCNVNKNSDRGLYLRSSGHGLGAFSASFFLFRRSESADCVVFAEDCDWFCEPATPPDVICLPKIAAVGTCTVTGAEGCVEAVYTSAGLACASASACSIAYYYC